MATECYCAFAYAAYRFAMTEAIEGIAAIQSIPDALERMVEGD